MVETHDERVTKTIVDDTKVYEEFVLLAKALDMPMEEWEKIAEQWAPLVNSKLYIYPDRVPYNDALSELLDFVRSMDVEDMDPKHAFCCGIMMGIAYQPHLKREIERRTDAFFDICDKEAQEVS